MLPLFHRFHLLSRVGRQRVDSIIILVILVILGLGILALPASSILGIFLLARLVSYDLSHVVYPRLWCVCVIVCVCVCILSLSGSLSLSLSLKYIYVCVCVCVCVYMYYISVMMMCAYARV